ncbi:MAG: hypothetical protein LBC87_01715 [Fibromonadaceae bacterium]|jgi:hypothetical protein|nr:hypothetical protein [Fibromonadaceae bacterium]
MEMTRFVPFIAKSTWSIGLADDEQEIISQWNILLQGERNVVYRAEVRWNGFLRINNLAYEVE